MKLSISLSEQDVALLDEIVQERGLSSRSAAVQEALHLLRQAGLADAYADAWSEWESSGEAQLWGDTTGDGVE